MAHLIDKNALVALIESYKNNFCDRNGYLEDSETNGLAKFLQKIFFTNNDTDTMECAAQVLTAEAEGNTDFFISSLDEVIKFCEKLKKDVWNESKTMN